MSNLAYRIHQLECQLAQEQAQTRRESLQTFAEELVASGKISCNDRPGLVDFMTSLPDGTGAEFLQKFLSDRPQVPEYTLSPQLQIAYSKARNAYEAGWKRGEL